MARATSGGVSWPVGVVGQSEVHEAANGIGARGAGIGLSSDPRVECGQLGRVKAHEDALAAARCAGSADQAVQLDARVRAAMVQFGPLPPYTYTMVETGLRGLSCSSGVAPEKLAVLLETVCANIDAKAN